MECSLKIICESKEMKELLHLCIASSCAYLSTRISVYGRALPFIIIILFLGVGISSVLLTSQLVSGLIGREIQTRMER